jgi:hypothetical protein
MKDKIELRFQQLELQTGIRIPKDLREIIATEIEIQLIQQKVDIFKAIEEVTK